MNIPFFLQIAGMFLIPFAAVLVPFLLGERYGIHCVKKSIAVPNTPVGSIVASTLGLFAFMLAFTFQIVTTRYNARKELLIDEVTNIRTAWLRAGLIPEPYHSNTKRQIVEYVDLRVDLAADLSKLNYAISRSQQILDSLWTYTEALAAQDRSSEIYALYTIAINNMVDAYNKRMTLALMYRIPVAILWVLFIINFFSMFILGYQFGISGKGDLRINLLLAAIFAVVMFLILTLDHPETGLVRLSQEPMLALQQQLKVH